MTSLIEVVGSASARPPNSEAGQWPSIDLDFEAFGKVVSGSHAIAHSIGSPFSVEGVPSAKLVVVRPDDGVSVVVRVVSSQGIALIPISGPLLLRAPDSDSFTSVSLAGTGDVAYLVAG